LPSITVYEYALIQGGFGDFNTATGRTQLFEEAERLIEPIRLYREGRVKKLFITGDGSFSNDKFPESKECL
jgi:vancomycin permeability regulator SanA